MLALLQAVGTDHQVVCALATEQRVPCAGRNRRKVMRVRQGAKNMGRRDHLGI